MTSAIVNGAGMVKSLGTADRSRRVVPVQPEQVPQHLPMIFLFAEQGKGKRLLSGAEREKVFGSKTFDVRSPYFNHTTLFANEANSKGNSCMYQRLIPDDAGPRANAILWLDVLETTVDRYQRNPDGSIALDSFGEPTIIGTAPGLKAKWVKTHRITVNEQEGFGNKTQVQGDQVDGLTTSVRYPIFEIENAWEGAAGNNTVFRLWAPTTAGGRSLPVKMMQQSQAYPYNFAIMDRENENATPQFNETIFGEQNVLFTFKKGVVNPLTDQEVSYDKILPDAYNQVDRPGFPDITGRIGKFYVYDDNIEAVLDLMYQYESDFIDENSDITEEPSSKHLLNFVTGVNSSNIPYESFIFVDSQTSVRMSEYSNVFLSGGSDGTMDNDMFETLVNRELDRYMDAEDEVQDTAFNVESWIYDSGFSLPTKFKLAQFISVRKDTIAVLGTHVVGEEALTAAEEHSVAISLRTRLQMFPESEYFGTPVCRAIIQGRSGEVRDSKYTLRVPATFELISKYAEYMGAGNGAWKSGKSPEGSPGHIVNRLKNINITWSSDNARNLDWDVGLNWILRFDRENYFIPHYKTVYDDDTSVLNSILVAAAIAYLNKVAQNCWRFFVGRSDLTPQQLTDECNQYVSEAVFGKFDNRYVIEPAATMTDMDSLRGFSWTLPIKIGADNMRTVMTTYVEAYRKEDLVAETGA